MKYIKIIKYLNRISLIVPVSALSNALNKENIKHQTIKTIITTKRIKSDMISFDRNMYRYSFTKNSISTCLTS